MARKKKLHASKSVSNPAPTVAYSATLATDVIKLLDDTVASGVEGLTTLCTQLVGDDGRYALVSMITNFSVEDIKKLDPKLDEFRKSLRSSLKSHPAAMLQLIARVKKSLSLSSTIDDPQQKQAFDNVSNQLKQIFSL